MAAAPEAIIAGSDDGKRPPWLDDWKRWRDVPAVRYGNLFVANGDLLHRSGPRFVDGVESLCVMLDAARANRSKTPLGREERRAARVRYRDECLAEQRG